LTFPLKDCSEFGNFVITLKAITATYFGMTQKQAAIPFPMTLKHITIGLSQQHLSV